MNLLWFFRLNGESNQTGDFLPIIFKTNVTILNRAGQGMDYLTVFLINNSLLKILLTKTPPLLEIFVRWNYRHFLVLGENK